MKLKLSKREGAKKSENNRLRREGKIPAIIYSQGKVGESLAVDKEEFAAALRGIEKGSLPTTQFTLVDEKGKERKAVIKEIQYHVTTYAVEHLDFEELHKDVAVKVKVPIDCIGVAECEGVKLGGALRQVIRHMEVKCLPKDMPSRFQIDVTNLGMRQSMRLESINIPKGIKAVNSLKEIAVTVSKR